MNKLVITYSEMSALRECRRRHLFSYERRLRPKMPQKKLSIGNMGHVAIAEYLVSQDTQKALASFDELMEKDISRIRELGSFDKVDDLAIPARAVRAAVRVYFETQGPKDLRRYEVITIDDKPGVEYSFQVPVLNPNTRRKLPKAFYAGKIDALVRDRHLNVYALFDHKFLSQFDSNINVLSIDLQITLYCYAIGRILGEFPTIAVYNVIKKPTYKKKKDESLTEYEERVYSRLLKEGKGTIRATITRGPSHFKVAEQELYEAVRAKRRKNEFAYRNIGQHCSWKCAFKEICFNEDPFLLDELFEVKEFEHEELGV